MVYGSLILILLMAWLGSLLLMQRRMRDLRQRLVSSEREAQPRNDTGLARVDALMEALDEPVFRLDRQGRVLSANRRAKEVFHLSRAGSLGQSLLFYYRDPDWHEQFSRHMVALDTAVALPAMEIYGRVLAPRLVPLGRDQVLLFCMDITDLHRLERQRRTFLANLMHDLKTPLTSLLGYARSLERFGEDEAFRQEASRVIADEAMHVNRLLEAMLTLDQIEFAERDRDARCDAQEVVRKLLEALAPRAEERSIRFVLEDAHDHTMLALPVEDLERMLSNVLENAIRYSPAGGCIRVQITELDEGFLRLRIEDEGPGVPENDLPRLTERFYRVDKVRSRREGGHGLGLAIVKELVDLHQGRLTICNRDPHGLRVDIALPKAGMHRSSDDERANPSPT